MENFWASLKNELVHHQRYATRADAKAAIQEYIESFYNRQRTTRALATFRQRCSPKILANNASRLKQDCPLLTVHLTSEATAICECY